MIKLALKNLSRKKTRSLVLILTLAFAITAITLFQGLKTGLTNSSYQNAEASHNLDIITINPMPSEQGLAGLLNSSKNKISESQIIEIQKISGVENIYYQNQFNSFASLEASVFGVSFLTDTMVFGHQAEFLGVEKNKWQSSNEAFPAIIPTNLLELYN